MSERCDEQWFFSFFDVVKIFSDEEYDFLNLGPKEFRYEDGRSEERYVAIGMLERSRLIVAVVYTLREGRRHYSASGSGEAASSVQRAQRDRVMATAGAKSDTLPCCACSGPTDSETGRCVSQLYPSCQSGKASIVYKFTEAEIEAAMAADPDFPEISADDLRNAAAVGANGRVKRPVSIRLDEEILEYYRSLGPRYQTRINNDLLSLVREKKRRC